MGILTPEIQEFVRTQRLGFVATVCPDGTPNLSPKGTTTVWDDEHLVFADIHSPGTIQNLIVNHAIEINIVDIFTRKGYRFKGTAQIYSKGELFKEIVAFYHRTRTDYQINNIALVRIDHVGVITSPVYDTQITEDDVIKRWSDYWNLIYPGKQA